MWVLGEAGAGIMRLRFGTFGDTSIIVREGTKQEPCCRFSRLLDKGRTFLRFNGSQQGSPLGRSTRLRHSFCFDPEANWK